MTQLNRKCSSRSVIHRRTILPHIGEDQRRMLSHFRMNFRMPYTFEINISSHILMRNEWVEIWLSLEKACQNNIKLVHSILVESISYSSPKIYIYWCCLFNDGSVYTPDGIRRLWKTQFKCLTRDVLYSPRCVSGIPSCADCCCYLDRVLLGTDLPLQVTFSRLERFTFLLFVNPVSVNVDASVSNIVNSTIVPALVAELGDIFFIISAHYLFHSKFMQNLTPPNVTLMGKITTSFYSTQSGLVLSISSSDLIRPIGYLISTLSWNVFLYDFLLTAPGWPRFSIPIVQQWISPFFRSQCSILSQSQVQIYNRFWFNCCLIIIIIEDCCCNISNSCK